ncbi:hypothetical protein D3C84_817650 [compost metagenome]
MPNTFIGALVAQCKTHLGRLQRYVAFNAFNGHCINQRDIFVAVTVRFLIGIHAFAEVVHRDEQLPLVQFQRFRKRFVACLSGYETGGAELHAVLAR